MGDNQAGVVDDACVAGLPDLLAGNDVVQETDIGDKGHHPDDRVSRTDRRREWSERLVRHLAARRGSHVHRASQRGLEIGAVGDVDPDVLVPGRRKDTAIRRDDGQVLVAFSKALRCTHPLQSPVDPGNQLGRVRACGNRFRGPGCRHCRRRRRGCRLSRCHDVGIHGKADTELLLFGKDTVDHVRGGPCQGDQLFVFQSREAAQRARNRHARHDRERAGEEHRSDKNELCSDLHVLQHFPSPSAPPLLLWLAAMPIEKQVLCQPCSLLLTHFKDIELSVGSILRNHWDRMARK